MPKTTAEWPDGRWWAQAVERAFRQLPDQAVVSREHRDTHLTSVSALS
jgi:hypothetical protein